MTKEQSYTRFWEGSKRMWITFLFFSFIMIGFVQAANTAFAQTTVTVNVQDATLSVTCYGKFNARRILLSFIVQMT